MPNILQVYSGLRDVLSTNKDTVLIQVLFISHNNGLTPTFESDLDIHRRLIFENVQKIFLYELIIITYSLYVISDIGWKRTSFVKGKWPKANPWKMRENCNKIVQKLPEVVAYCESNCSQARLAEHYKVVISWILTYVSALF